MTKKSQHFIFTHTPSSFASNNIIPSKENLLSGNDSCRKGALKHGGETGNASNQHFAHKKDNARREYFSTCIVIGFEDEGNSSNKHGIVSFQEQVS